VWPLEFGSPRQTPEPTMALCRLFSRIRYDRDVESAGDHIGDGMRGRRELHLAIAHVLQGDRSWARARF
jgi:hypothetical protein